MSVILVVDDEEDIRELVGIYLKNEGMQVCKAANGKEALECLEKMDIDLAILDIMMADMDGITLCMEIRKKSIFRLLCCRQRIRIWTRCWD